MTIIITLSILMKLELIKIFIKEEVEIKKMKNKKKKS